MSLSSEEISDGIGVEEEGKAWVDGTDEGVSSDFFKVIRGDGSVEGLTGGWLSIVTVAVGGESIGVVLVEDSALVVVVVRLPSFSSPVLATITSPTDVAAVTAAAVVVAFGVGWSWVMVLT